MSSFKYMFHDKHTEKLWKKRNKYAVSVFKNTHKKLNGLLYNQQHVDMNNFAHACLPSNISFMTNMQKNSKRREINMLLQYSKTNTQNWMCCYTINSMLIWIISFMHVYLQILVPWQTCRKTIRREINMQFQYSKTHAINWVGCYPINSMLAKIIDMNNLFMHAYLITWTMYTRVNNHNDWP